MKYIAYVRRSNEDRNKQVQSIEKQIDWVEKEAKRRSLNITKVFQDTQSAHKLGRPSFSEMIEYIHTSKEPITILCWKINRLARNPRDEGEIKYAFMDKDISLQQIIASDREYGENANHIIMGVDFGQATQHSIDLSKDVTEGMMKKVEKGWAPYKVPYGYINESYAHQGERTVLIDPIYYEPIKRFLKQFLTGAYSVSELQTKMTKEWDIKTKEGKEFSTSSLYRILQNKFYCGYFVWKGESYKGAHKPMITLEEYNAIQALLTGTKHVTPSANKGENHFSGFLQCKCCGAQITGYSKSKQTKKGESNYHYLKCTKSQNKKCSQHQVNRKNIDKQMNEILQSVHLDEGIFNFLLKRKAHENKEKEKSFDRERVELQKKLDKISNDQKELAKRLVSNVINDAMYKQLESEFKDEQEKLSEQLENYQKKQKNWINELRDTFQFCETAPSKYKEGDYETKKFILRNAGSNFFLNGDKLEIELDPALIIVQRHIKRVSENRCRIEPQKSLSGKDLIGVSEDGFLEWYPC